MKLALQIGLGLFSLVPLGFAILGIVTGASYFMPDGGYPAGIDNQFRYLSAIYLLVTFLLWWIIPKIETQGAILAFICGVIFIGGIARFVSHTSVGPGLDVQFTGMIVELLVPLFYLWQRLVARSSSAA